MKLSYLASLYVCFLACVLEDREKISINPVAAEWSKISSVEYVASSKSYKE